MLDTIWRDLAHAVRSLGRTPGFTATAALVALIAAAFPAVRAARVNPIGALRSE
jgi:ABC-type antimicrobial peptide transport system permease subunit